MSAPGTDLIVHPLTGEALELRAPTTDLAAAIDQAKEMEGALREYKRAIADEILRRMDHEGTWTARLGPYKVTGDGPRQPTYDGERLRSALERLVQVGRISERAMEKAVELVTDYKVKKAGINALLKLGPDVAAAVRGAEEQNLKPRGVRVSVEP